MCEGGRCGEGEGVCKGWTVGGVVYGVCVNGNMNVRMCGHEELCM